MRIFPLGERALIVKFGVGIDPVSHRKVLELTRTLEQNPFPGFHEAVPSYVSVAIYYDPVIVGKAGRPSGDAQSKVVSWLTERATRVHNAAVTSASTFTGNTVEIPVCYCSECGPDLPFVAEHNILSPDDVIKIHTSGSYTVHHIVDGIEQLQHIHYGDRN
ncbi:carboxyltransferase domain-containing protein [Paenibacillus sp. sptzw28]|uniref:carboxyltransferase domain-containing protein n=1 Tax=Paenibacillus sp. sptzw28 TaxID=715179 RepID=UPI0037C677FC